MSEYMVQKYILSICKNTLPFIPEKIWRNNEFIYVNFHKYNSKMQFFTLMPIIMIYLTC